MLQAGSGDILETDRNRGFWGDNWAVVASRSFFDSDLLNDSASLTLNAFLWLIVIEVWVTKSI